MLSEDKYVVAFSVGTIYIDLPPKREYTNRQIAYHLQDNGANRPIQFYDGRLFQKGPYNPAVFSEQPQIITTSSLNEILLFLIPLVQDYTLRHAMEIDGKPPTIAPRTRGIDEERDAILLRYARIQTGKIRQ